ncbi:nitrogenase iron-molybdenum cofactor biosynthesis protein NifN [Rhodocyclus tenuis]|uniref:nitrogenase iron-molybdenum cofactor biosynthesis protein NifN n=1 Tax=Rhodocyclus gracilis TaxID=2929842 RepID=UPI001298BC07|nr:nitrogenase iron-molybdenum cofactor biosynthesis protein NifN [Rhodocyclus gracilis]MRD72376.1 nitrogenase iron-molybdenum cofactor biosynthesis protein NifN [Rhodocyclus gracilis]
MAEIVKKAKPLTVNPLKASQPMGAALAFLGLRDAIPLLHGSQGCTAFGKVFFVRHFREPIPLQTTAMDLVSTIMNADENVLAGLKALCEKSQPQVIGLATTGLSETQGTDIHSLVTRFRTACPQFAHVAIVPVNTPDYVGSLESGFALAVEAMIDTLVPASNSVGRRRQVNVLASSMLTPGDLEQIREWIEAFGLRAVLLPDLGDSLDGHLVDAENTPLTLGGTPRGDIDSLGESLATLVIGRSLARAADLLRERTGVPDLRFDHLLGLDACDAFTGALATLAGVVVPERIERQRTQLQDAMVDTHFMTGFTRIALALDPDALLAFGGFLSGVGAEIVAAVAPTRADCLAQMPCASVRIGDLADLEEAARQANAQILIASSHAAATAQSLGIPLWRAGFPQYDFVGGYARVWVGYRGARQALFDLANLVLGHHHEIPVYRSIYRDDGAQDPARLVCH